jgi:hypothetical protein
LNYCGFFNFLIPNPQKRFKAIGRDCETEQNQTPQSGNGGGRGVKFVVAAVYSHKQNGIWTDASVSFN